MDAIIFYNTPEDIQLAILDKLSSKSNSNVASARDDFTIAIDQSLEQNFVKRPDGIIFSQLDFNSLRIISQVLGQSVGMSHLDSRLQKSFEKLMSLLEFARANGKLNDFQTNIVRFLAETNLIRCQLLAKLKVMDLSEIVWQYSTYESLNEQMRKEFDIKERIEAMTLKLDLIHNTQSLFLDILQHRKSSRMELIIIALIAIEVAIAIMHYSSELKECFYPSPPIR